MIGARVRGATEYVGDHSSPGSVPSSSRTSTKAAPDTATEYRPHMPETVAATLV